MTSFSQLLPGYQKSTQTFWMCHIVYFNRPNMKRNLGHLSCTRGPPQPIAYHTPATDGTERRRMVVGISKHEHTTQVLRSTLDWLPVTARIQFKFCCVDIRLCPKYWSCLPQARASHLSSLKLVCSAGCGDLVCFAGINTSIGQRSFTIAASVVWNALPRSPHNSRRRFRSKLKTYIFRQAYNIAGFL